MLLFDGPVRADVQVSYRLPLPSRHPVRLRLRVENLLGRADFEAGFRTPGRTITAGLSVGE